MPKNPEIPFSNENLRALNADGTIIFDVESPETIYKIENDRPIAFFDIELDDQPISRITFSAANTDSINTFHNTYTARLKLNTEIVDEGWLDQGFWYTLDSPELSEKLVGSGITINPAENPNAFEMHYEKTGSSYAIALERKESGIYISVSNGETLFPFDSKVPYAASPALKHQIDDQTNLEEFLGAVGNVLTQITKIAQSGSRVVKIENFPPDHFFVSEDQAFLPSITVGDEAPLHRPIFNEHNFALVLRRALAEADLEDPLREEELEEEIVRSENDNEALADAFSRSEEFTWDDKIYISNKVGLTETERETLEEFSQEFFNSIHFDFSMPRGMAIAGKDQQFLEEIVDAFANSTGATLIKLSVHDIASMARLSSTTNLMRFFRSANIVGRSAKTSNSQRYSPLVLHIEELGESFSEDPSDIRSSRTLANALSECMSRRKDLIVIATTEKLKLLPESFLAPDVLGRSLKIGKRKEPERLELLASGLARVIIEDSHADKNRIFDGQGFDMHKLVSASEGLTATQILKAIDNAEIRKFDEMKRFGKPTLLTEDDIARSIRDIDQ